MHYTGTLYRNPYEPPSPLLEITQGCTHNECKFCNMYKNVQFRPSPIEWIEEDIMEIATSYPDVNRLQLIGADPFCLSFERLDEICDLVNRHLPDVEIMTMAARVTNVKNKTVEQLKILKERGMVEVNIGAESGDDWTLKRINKGYQSKDILEQCNKLDKAGINYWLTYLNGVAGVEHSNEHAINSAKIFSECNPIVVGTGGLTLFEGTELLEEYRAGKFNPLDEKALMTELLTFIENLDLEGRFITHHTSSMNLNTMHFNKNKSQIVSSLKYGIKNFDMEYLAGIRENKRGL
ncbi:MAG TPA: radical SAM protein [Methanosphaera sp.]|nr:radical SAM protein [Methanosphaera sp.]